VTTYGAELTPAQRAALARYGYDPDLTPNGCTGPPRTVIHGSTRGPDGTFVPILLRYRVCKLDGVLIDGHEPSDLDPGGPCLHCLAEPEEMDRDGDEGWPS